MAFTDPKMKLLSEAEFEKRAKARVSGELGFFDGATWGGVTKLNKHVRKVLAEEKHILSVENPKFIHGSGLGFDGGDLAVDQGKKRKTGA